MKEAEVKLKEERRQELETIRIRQAADEIFRRNEEEKWSRKFDENKELAGFHLSQVVSTCCDSQIWLVVMSKNTNFM